MGAEQRLAGGRVDATAGGSFSFRHGHVLNWGVMGVPDAMPLYERAPRPEAAHGAAKRDWMFNMRDRTIFPNMQIAENASSRLRVDPDGSSRQHRRADSSFNRCRSTWGRNGAYPLPIDGLESMKDS